MYPYFEVGDYKFHLTGIGIILATIIFLIGVYRYSKKNNLKFSYFFSYLSFFILVPYILGRYFYDLLEYKFFVPTDLLQLLLPYNYRFSFIGVSLGFIIVLGLFLSSLKYKQERKKWIDVFFYSISLFLIVIGPFLLLGDNFYGKLTDSIFGIIPFTDKTSIPYTKPIWPVGIFVSILGLVLYIVAKLLHFFIKKPGITIYLMPIFFFAMAWIFTFQHYSKHFIFGIDIKIFYSIFMGIFFPICLYLITKNNNYKG